MQLSETITIYLAIGAPFGVNYFLRKQVEKDRSRARTLFQATGAGLLWPLLALANLLRRQSPGAALSPAADRESALADLASEKCATAQHDLLAALEGVRELAQTTVGTDEELEQTIRMVREGIEKYVGLTLALVDIDLDDPPASREMELCKVAGREGDDLLLAGHCVHRRNVARLIAHQARARTELLHALATVREIKGVRRGQTPLAVTAARHLSVVVLKFYGQAINLLSLLEDESATLCVARLLDAECARLRGLEATGVNADATVGGDSKHVRHAYTDWPTLAPR